jgi:hypothetical protein
MHGTREESSRPETAGEAMIINLLESIRGSAESAERSWQGTARLIQGANEACLSVHNDPFQALLATQLAVMTSGTVETTLCARQATAAAALAAAARAGQRMLMYLHNRQAENTGGAGLTTGIIQAEIVMDELCAIVRMLCLAADHVGKSADLLGKVLMPRNCAESGRAETEQAPDPFPESVLCAKKADAL